MQQFHQAGVHNDQVHDFSWCQRLHLKTLRAIFGKLANRFITCFSLLHGFGMPSKQDRSLAFLRWKGCLTPMALQHDSSTTSMLHKCIFLQPAKATQEKKRNHERPQTHISLNHNRPTLQWLRGGSHSGGRVLPGCPWQSLLLPQDPKKAPGNNKQSSTIWIHADYPVSCMQLSSPKTSILRCCFVR